jgi:Ni,Fe-hydrogenase III large subunit
LVAAWRLDLSRSDRGGSVVEGRLMAIDIIDMAPDALATAASELIAAGGRLQMAYGWRPAPDCLELRYLATAPSGPGFVVWRVQPGDSMPSLTPVSPLMSWYEREITDLYGLGFSGHPEPRPLIVPPADRIRTNGDEVGDENLPLVQDPQIQRLPFGPVRADVVESVELVFLYVGEHILHVHPQLFFKHRAMEERFEGRRFDHGVVLAERVSGVGGLAHALAFCQALEQAAGCEPPPRAQRLRVVLAELERIYNHLHYLGHLADTTTLKVGQAEGRLLEEQAKQINARLTGSRLLRGLLAPGGLRRDLAPSPGLAADLRDLRARSERYAAMLEADNSYLDRLISTGPLTRQLAFDQGATGPVERGSGIDRDLRRDHPYAAYNAVPPDVPTRPDGDAHARAQVRIAELWASFDLIDRTLAALEPGAIRTDCTPPPASEGLGWAESPRGALYYAVHFDDEGRLKRVKIKSPSFSNWRVFPFTVNDTNMMDYAINEASFGMTVAGCDR